uniref:Strictosidine synthase conserved region domain-containing protein n=1 Tax=Oryza punctata TaxID=4537 RepID=A0A0E0LW85_ORYPU
MAPKLHPAELTESKCGRPLGLRFHNTSGNLYIADAVSCVSARARGGEATVLATEADGMPFRFTNGVDVNQVTSEVYFTDSNTRFPRSQHERGSKAGTSEPFTELPGYPDNVRPDGKGGYWVALHREKTESPYGSDTHLLAVRIGRNGKRSCRS